MLGVPLRVGLCAAMACLYGQPISTAIPNANKPISEFQLRQFFRACWGFVFGRKNEAFLSETRQILQP
jgi:hypothetical protein